jgi:predicted GNAT family acetyltransferase
LVRDLVGRILDSGDTPILHVMTTNVGAIRIYDELGFETRRAQDIIGLRPPA